MGARKGFALDLSLDLGFSFKISGSNEAQLKSVWGRLTS